MEVLPALGKDFPRPTNEIALSEHCYTIYTMLRSGWHPEAVAMVMRRQYGVSFTSFQIGQYLRELPMADLTPRALNNYFGNQDFVVDVLGDMHKILVLAEQRLITLMRLEEQDPKWAPYVGSLTKDVFQMLKETALTELELGVNRHGDKEAPQQATAMVVETVEQIINRTRVKRESHERGL